MAKQRKKQPPARFRGPAVWIALAAVAAACLLAGGILLSRRMSADQAAAQYLSVYQRKIELLRAEALRESTLLEYGIDPAGDAGYAVFISLCDTTQRASVYTGTGADPFAAWADASQKAEAALRKDPIQPAWVKADVAYISDTVTMEELTSMLKSSRPEFFHYGVSFDPAFETALLDAELNGAKIFDYDADHSFGVDLAYLNNYLEAAGRPALKSLPDACTLFRCFAWLCDEEEQVWSLSASGLSYGRRRVDTVDADYAAGLIRTSSDFLLGQLREDGSFIYGWYPRFDNEIENYNIVRHASTIWSLVCRWRMDPSDELAARIESAIDYMLTQVVYDQDGRAYLYEAKDDEIKLGGSGVAVIAMTEYMDALGVDTYAGVCRQLGEGILSMMDAETGSFRHVLNGDFTPKADFRTVYYDGEAAFALCRLYGLTGEQLWLDAACAAADHFIEADYAQYRDHWVAYTMNELTRYVTDRPDYYAFALQNAQDNLQAIYDRDTTYHTYLELLMSTFEVYDRLIQMGAQVDGFDIDMLLQTIERRADRQLNGYFYPEVAMYMANPARILNTFMVRHDGYRVRIDDVQHNIGGYYLYWKNYDRLLAYGLGSM